MQPIDATASRYDRRTIIFHWLTAGLVAFQWVGAQVIDYFPKGALRVDARSVHIAGGMALAVVLVARIVWRVKAGRRLPIQGGAFGVGAKAVHLFLYLLLMAMVTTGIVLAWTRGDSLFNLVNIPRFDPADGNLPHRVQGVHRFIGWAIVCLVGLHASAALIHQYLLRDGVLARMRPGGQAIRQQKGTTST